MTSTFADLGVPEDLISVLAKQGIESPFAIQTLTISDALKRRDVCGKAKTGAGKPLAVRVPAVAHPERNQQGKPPTLMLTLELLAILSVENR